MQLKLVFLFGATGIGKTEFISELGIQGLEVISADSMQVYRELNIGTAKPENLVSPPYHLVNVCDPREQFTLADFVRLAEEAVVNIRSRSALPLVSGGTAYYFKHLWFGLPFTPPSNPNIRSELETILRTEGLPALYSELKAIDPHSAERIGAKNTQRIIRAIEVYRITQKPLSAFPLPSRPLDDRQILAYGMYTERDKLYTRINQRVENMFQKGLEQEVRSLIQSGLGAKDPAMQAIGYREFFQPNVYATLLSGHSLSHLQRTELIANIQQASRRYAKRQITFFSKLPRVQWIHRDSISYIDIRRNILNFLA